MPDYAWHWSGYALAILASLFVLWSLFADRARGRKRCRKCWYDLASLGEVPTTCPECGKAHAKPKHLIRTRRRYRRAIIGLVFLIASYGLWTTPRVVERGWYGAVPTTGLILAAPWLPRAAMPSDSKLQDPNEEFFQFVLRAHERNRVLDDSPQSFAEELEIRWFGYPTQPRMPDYIKRIGIRWWSLCGALRHFGKLPSDPSHYTYGADRNIPSILASYEFGFDTLSGKETRTVAGALLLTQQPPVWKHSNKSYSVDPGAMAESLDFPLETKIVATLIVPPNDQGSKELKLHSPSSFVGGFSTESFVISDPAWMVVIQYDIQLRDRHVAIRHTVSYEIVPWPEPKSQREDPQWGQAVPRFLNGIPINPVQNPERHFQAHVHKLFISNED